MNYKDFEQFKKKYETENNVSNKCLNAFNDNDGDENNENDSFDYLFDRKTIATESKY